MKVYQARFITIENLLSNGGFIKLEDPKPVPTYSSLLGGDLQTIIHTALHTPGNGKFWYKHDSLIPRPGRSPEVTKNYYIYSLKTGLCLCIEEIPRQGEENILQLTEGEKIQSWIKDMHDLLSGERPIDIAERKFRAGVDEWVEMSEEDFWWFLECVPPRKQGNNRYLCGEPWTQLSSGEYVYLCGKQAGEKYFCKYMTIKQYETGIAPDYSLLPPHLNLANLTID